MSKNKIEPKSRWGFLAALLCVVIPAFAFKSSEDQTEWTFTSDEVDAIQKSAQDLADEIKSLKEAGVKSDAELKKYYEDILTSEAALKSSNKILSDTYAQVGITKDPEAAKLAAAITKLKLMPGATGVETDTDDDDTIDGGKKEVKTSWQIDADKRSATAEKMRKLGL